MEQLSFKVSLSATLWDKEPEYTILLDGKTIENSTVGSDLKTIDFSSSLEDGSHQLIIRLENKTPHDTQLDNGNIVNDMLLNIEDVEIDNVSLNSLLWDFTYKLDQEQEYNGKLQQEIKGCRNLGWNGSYIIDFETPFYLWLLEKL
jgi:hypothetical protein